MRGFQEEPTNPEIKEMQAVEGGLDKSQTDSSTGTSGPWNDSEMRSGAFPLNKSILAEENRPTDTADVSSQTAATNYYPVFGNFTLEKIIESIDGAGSYQRMLVMCSMLCMFGSSFVSFCISFLAAEPLFKCEKADQPGTFVDCSERIACQESNPQVYFRYNSWTESMQMYCEQKFARESGKFVCLLVNSLTCFFCLNLSDVYGRKKMIVVNTIVVILALIASYLCSEYHIKMMFVGLAFGCEGCFSSLYLFLINEVSTPTSKLKSRISAYTLASFSIGVMCLNLMSFGFKTADHLMIAIIICLVVILYPNMVVLKESPTWLIKQNRIEEATANFKKISIFNGRSLPDLYFGEMLQALQDSLNSTQESADPSGKSYDHKLSFIERLELLFTNKDYRTSLFILASVSSSLFCLYYGMTTSIQDMGLEPLQLNGLFVGFTQAVGFLLVLKYLATTKRKLALLLIQSSLLFCAFLLVTLSFFEEYRMSIYLQGAISTIIMSAFISALFSFLFVTNAETFPTQIKGLAVGLILLIGKLVGSLAPFINLFSKHMKVHVMVGSALPLFLSLLTSMCLRETLDPALTAKRHKLKAHLG